MTCYICDKHPQVKKGCWCSDCQAQFKEIFHQPGRKEKYDCRYAIGEKRFYPVITGKEQHSIRCTFSRYGKEHDQTFSCTAIPGGFEVERLS